MATFAINDSLNCTVSKRTLCYMTADGLQPWNEKQAVVRDDNDVALGVVSPEYELVQNEDLKSLINPMVSEGVLTIVKQGYLNKGARVFIQAEVNQEFQVVGENYKGLITLLNGHTGNASVAIGTTATRVICGNTFSMAYKDIGEKEKAIIILEKQIQRNEEEDFVGAYDYVHLGVLYLETNRLEKAIETFKKQLEINDLAENHYYLALTYLKLEKPSASKSSLEKAKELYIEGRRMFDTYATPMDKIYLENIESALKTAYDGSDE